MQPELKTWQNMRSRVLNTDTSMSQTDRLLVALKDELRRQRKTYAQAARVLDLSEASIKRLFSERNLSLQRLDTLCNWLGLEISDLVRGMEAVVGDLISVRDGGGETIGARRPTPIPGPERLTECRLVLPET